MALAAGISGLAGGSADPAVRASASPTRSHRAEATARKLRVATAQRSTSRATAKRAAGAGNGSSAPLSGTAALLDPALSQPQPGDSSATRAARAKLAKTQAQYDVANQDYDQAAQTLQDINARLVKDRVAAARARAAATQAQSRLVAQVQSQYLASSQILVPVQALLGAQGPGLLDRIDVSNQISKVQTDLLQSAQQLEHAAEIAEQSVASSQTQAAAARDAAAGARDRAATALTSAAGSLAVVQAADSVSSGSYYGGPGDGIAAAALALRARALASGAATAASIPAGTSAATTIALAARALLNQAAGRGPRPVTGLPFTVTHGTPVDEQAVMGPTPQLGGTASYGGSTGSAAGVQALTPFTGALAGLPAFPAGYTPLRAEVAVDQALAVLGTPYVWDAAGPSSFDCSGLTMWSWQHAGVALRHYTGDQVNEGVRVAANQLLPGDLVLFGSDLHHVGMYLGAGYMIDAPDTGDVVKVQRMADDGDFAVAVRP